MHPRWRAGARKARVAEAQYLIDLLLLLALQSAAFRSLGVPITGTHLEETHRHENVFRETQRSAA